jgi:hypothetical protein
MFAVTQSVPVNDDSRTVEFCANINHEKSVTWCVTEWYQLAGIEILVLNLFELTHLGRGGAMYVPGSPGISILTVGQRKVPHFSKI